MTVGGKTMGKATKVSINGFILLLVLANHHAKGVPNNTNNKVLTPANLKLKSMAVMSGHCINLGSTPNNHSQ